MSQSSPARATRPKRPVLSSRARQFWLTLHYLSLLAWVAGAGGCVLLVFFLSRPQAGLESAALISARLRLLSSQGSSLVVLLGMVVISVYKPWGKRGAGRPVPRSAAQR